MSFANFIRENSGGIHQAEGQLEMAKDWNCFWKFFIFENFSTWAGRPWELGHLKNLCVFPPSFICAFEHLIIIFSALSSLISFKCAFEPSSLWALFVEAFKPLSPFKCAFKPYLLSSAPLRPWPSKVVRFLNLPLFWTRFWALTFFEHAFKPSFPVERAFEPSFPFERAFEPSYFLKHVCEPSLPLESAFEPSTILLSASSSPHFPFFFLLG